MNTQPDNDLFPAAFALSPRLKWRTAHDVHVTFHPNRENRQEWRARIGMSQVLADSEDAAEIALCEKHGLIHWTLLP